jgi:hypothetical protein
MHGSLKSKSLPRLLCELWQQKATGALKLNKRLVEKKFYLRKGQLIQADSNLLQDTFGNFLVRQGIIDEIKLNATLENCQTTGKRLGEVLVEEGLIDATAIYKKMQELLTAKVVDCFLWDDGNYEFTSDALPPSGQLDLSVDPFHALVQGVQTTMPFERMRADISLVLNKPVRVAQAQLPSWSDGYLNTTSLKLLKAFHEPKKPRFVMEELAIAEETMLRIVYIFDVTGLILNTDLPLSAEKAPTATVVPTAPSETLSNGLSEKAGKELIDRVLALTLKLDKTNHFELLGIDFDTTPVGMSIAYLKFVEHFSPHYFSSGSLAQYRRQNENILLAAADAYADLRDNESKVRYNDKLKARRNAEENARKKIPGAAFKIQTDLLDASSQFEQGLKHLEQRHFDNAVKYFEYACDIDGREPLYIAYLAWSKYQKYGGASNASPSDAKEIGGLFETAIKEGTDNAKVNMLYGKYLSDKPETKKKGLFHLKKAVTLSPKDLEIERTFRLANSQNS